ncbi:histone deacetylase family protein [Xinfangfangia sp. D13-10-4-6]|uniref:histone deacetylase family protein n=1 Tax=Pseudogemmobacter hezensis TaxID=2737662 RepID=UPI0015538F91|nr:histone deacetylase family protein [Pseudogemmobacter hezensis]NPD16769.1 histone deacetylase family protein [Pseudogemmobacter hezensis]
MKVFHSEDSLLHAPDFYFRRGRRIEHLERAERYEVLHRAAKTAGHEMLAPADFGTAPLQRVHSKRHIEFLATAWARRDEIEPGLDYVLPSHFARAEMHRYPDGMIGRVGFHMADLSTPLYQHSFDAVRASANVALSTAEAVAADRGHAYGLCRPPGHHASTESTGGFCFVNNAAVAAAHLQAKLGGKVAIIDIDVHHGNGTQIIFYDNPEVITASVHADPATFMPYYLGYGDETGGQAAEGCNLNLPLTHGSDDAVWHKAIERTMRFCADHGVSSLVVALGLDASEHDPNGALGVTTQGFRKAGQMLAGAGLPTAIIQEGGYLSEILGENLVAFLAGFDEARR